MVVLAVAVRFLVHRHIIAKLVLDDQTGFQQEIEGIVHRGTAYMVVLVLHLQVQHLHIKMLGDVVNLLQDGKALRCFPLLFLLKILPECFFDLRVQDTLY